MLTQKIAKNVFYIYHNTEENFDELTMASDEFIAGLDTLKHGNKAKEISAVSTDEITSGLSEVEKLWSQFYANVQSFKTLLPQKAQDDAALKDVVNSIYKQNSALLESVDALVTTYTVYSEEKTNFIKTFQYISGAILSLLFLYSLTQLKTIEAHVDSFMHYSKTLVENDDISNIKPIKLEAENEIELIEVGDTINSFIQKINAAVEYSNEALQQSQNASSKLEELTEEFDAILSEIKDASLASKYLNNSEDIVIESTEELINSTKKLANLKKELEKLTKSCQSLKNSDA
jgi:hypothetical protein